MQKMLEDIELNLEELKYLLEVASREPKIVPIAKRRVKEVIGCLEAIQEKLETASSFSSEDSSTEADVEDAFTEITNAVEEEHTTVVSEAQCDACEVVEAERVLHVASVAAQPVQSQPVLGEQLKPAAELNKCFTLNDTFRFSRELFGGETEEMNRVLKEISSMNAMTDVTTYLSSQFDWGEDNETADEFVEILKRYFA